MENDQWKEKAQAAIMTVLGHLHFCKGRHYSNMKKNRHSLRKVKAGNRSVLLNRCLLNVWSCEVSMVQLKTCHIGKQKKNNQQEIAKHTNMQIKRPNNQQKQQNFSFRVVYVRRACEKICTILLLQQHVIKMNEKKRARSKKKRWYATQQSKKRKREKMSERNFDENKAKVEERKRGERNTRKKRLIRTKHYPMVLFLSHIRKQTIAFCIHSQTRLSRELITLDAC